MFCLIIASLPICVSATEREELEAFEGCAFIKGGILFSSTEIFDPAEFEGDGPFDLLGISITWFEVNFPAKEEGDSASYYIKVAPDFDTFEAFDILSANENVTDVDFNYLEYPDDTEYYYPEDSLFIGKSKAELAEHYLFVSDEFTLCLNEELDLSEFEGEGKHYLYGVCVEEITYLETENEDSFIYNVKLGKQTMWNDDALTVFECNKNVKWVKSSSDYGNGDIDKDGDIDSADYITVKRMCLKTYCPSVRELGYADVNMDGAVDAVDYVLIKRHCLKTFDLFEVENDTATE